MLEHTEHHWVTDLSANRRNHYMYKVIIIKNEEKGGGGGNFLSKS